MADLHIPLDRKLFAGIDPGQTGGLGIVDEEGRFVAAFRWDKRNPRRMYEILSQPNNFVKPNIAFYYINFPMKKDEL